MTNPVAVTFHGHACFELTCADTSVLIDPFLSPNNPVATTSAEQVSPHHVVITHGHIDHIADAVAVCKRTNATAYALVELAEWLSKEGVTAVDLNLGGRVSFNGGTIGFVQAFHTNSLPDGTVIGQAAGAIIRIGSRCVYHVGDSALFSDMRLIAELEKVDILIVPIGGRYTMDIEAAVRATELVRPRTVIPCHYNTFPAIQVDPKQFADRVAALGGITAHIMAPGDIITL